MSSGKRGAAKGWSGEPVASRPVVPAIYGVPKDTRKLLPWSHVEQRMNDAKHYWICTVSPDGQPHATPVDGLWVDGKLYFGGSPETRRNRNLKSNPAACVHLENALEVLILQGEAPELALPDRVLTERLADLSARKYGYRPKPEEFETGGVRVFLPKKILAWTQFPSDATRWILPVPGKD